METNLFVGAGTIDLNVPNEQITVAAYVQDNGTPLFTSDGMLPQVFQT